MKHSGKIVMIFLLNLFTIVSIAQNAKIDSLKRVLVIAKDTQRVNCLNNLSEEINKHYDDIRDTVVAISYATQAFQEARELNYLQGMGDAMARLATVRKDHSNLTLAAQNFASAISYYVKTNNTYSLAHAYFNLARAWDKQAKWQSSLEAYFKSYQLYKKINNIGGSGFALTMVGLVYGMRGDFENAFKYGYQALRERESNKEYMGVSWAYINLGRLFAEVEDYPTAIDYFQSIRIQYAERHNSQWFPVYDRVALAYWRMGHYDSALHYMTKFVQASWAYPDSASFKKRMEEPDAMNFSNEDMTTTIGVTLIHLLHKDYDKTLKNCLGAIKFYESIDAWWNEMQLLPYIAEAYMGKGDFRSALLYSRKLLDLAQSVGARQYVRDGTELTWQIYDHEGPIDSAYKYYQRYTAMKDSVSNYRFLSKMTTFKEAAANEQKELAYQQNLAQEALTRKVLAAGIVVILIISAFALRNIALKRKSEKSQRVILQNDLQIQKLESEKTKSELQQQASELEMQALRAQMNPHFIFNSLNSINRFVLQNDRLQASQYLTKFSKLMRLILQNSQASLITLESELECMQLYLELEALRFEHRFAFKISVPKDLDISELKVPPLIIQPYAENAIWHGLMHKEDKGQLDIEVNEEYNYLYLKISDNGIGRKKARELASKSATKHKSAGLRITEERIAMLQQTNGEESPVEIHDLTNPDGSAAGTEVIIRIPVIYEN